MARNTDMRGDIGLTIIHGFVRDTDARMSSAQVNEHFHWIWGRLYPDRETISPQLLGRNLSGAGHNRARVRGEMMYRLRPAFDPCVTIE